jgi:hypothetical protein
MITRQRDGAQALSRDLTPLDRPDPPISISDVLKGLLEALTVGLYGIGEGALRQAVNKALSNKKQPDDPGFIDADNANDKVFDHLFETLIKDPLFGNDKGGDENRAGLLADFSDDQLELITKAGFLAFDKFESEGKNILRGGGVPELPITAAVQQERTAGGHDKRNQSGDPRVDHALALFDSINAAATEAFQIHYNTALRAWDSQLAQHQLGKDNLADTKLESLLAGTSVPTPPAGVLRVLLDLFAGPIEQSVEAKIDGLSPRTRGKLKGITGAQAKLPMVLDGSTGSRTLRVGVTEHGRILDLSTAKSAAAYLEKRGDGDRREGVLRIGDHILSSPLPDIDKA